MTVREVLDVLDKEIADRTQAVRRLTRGEPVRATEIVKHQAAIRRLGKARQRIVSECRPQLREPGRPSCDESEETTAA